MLVVMMHPMHYGYSCHDLYLCHKRATTLNLTSLSAADLNLLPVFQVLLEERNVTRAAGRLNLTQP